MVQEFLREKEEERGRGRDYNNVLLSWGERVGTPTGIWQFNISGK
jgi:hypothetical protein